MDFSKVAKNIKTIEDYISLTQNLAHKYKGLQFQFNMASVLSLKNLRSLEIEYFNKCDDIGAAFLIFERLQSFPPSKTWNLLGKEVVSFIRYWLDTVRKHLISHHPHWWSFLKHLLGFIKNIRLKDSSMIRILVRETAESLLDLATNNRMNSNQRFEVLHTFNLYRAESSQDPRKKQLAEALQELRLTLRPQFEHYFVKLSAIMASCGYFPTQFAIMETLLRWMLAPGDLETRRKVAAKWFPENLFPRKTVELFLERSWYYFCQDTRDFLNSLNESGDLVMSVVCKKLSVGKVVLLSGTERRQTWLDINSLERSLTVLMEPRLLQSVDAGRASCAALAVGCDNTVAAELYRESLEFIINVRTVEPPQVSPSDLKMFSEEDRDVSIVVGLNTNLARLSHALQAIFKDKYQVLLDLDNLPNLKTPLQDGFRGFTNKDDDARSHQAKETKRHKHSGYIVRTGNRTWKSPSTVSTTSLATLKDKLAAYPLREQNKGRKTVCADSILSVVEEFSEPSDIPSVDNDITLKLTPYDVCKTYKGKKSQSDTELQATRKSIGSSKVNQTKRNKSEQDYSNSCLFIATISTSDQSVINETLERLPNDENLIDSIVKDALNAKKNDRIDSGIIIDEGKKTQDLESIEAIENTPYVEPGKVRPVKENVSRAVVSKTTSDESNTEAISDTQMNYVSVRKKHLQRKKFTRQNNEQVVEKDQAISETSNQAVEDFFSRHFSENQASDFAVCPTLAKKINETSSENSEDLDKYLVSNNFNVNEDDLRDVEIIDCLNSIVDKVCNEFDTCTELLNRQTKLGILNAENYTDNMPLKETTNTLKEADHEEPIPMETKTKRKSLKLTYKKTKKSLPKTKVNAKRELMLESTKMTPIIEATDELALKNNSSKIMTNEETPLARRKRKLYSPKDDQMMHEKSEHDEEVIEKAAQLSSHEDVPLIKLKKRSNPMTPKSTATCYKEIEKDRQKYKIRKSKNKTESPLSSNTKKLNDVFDKLKDTVESNEKIVLADNKNKDLAVYNFTSDSEEDETFQKRRTENRKQTSTTTIDSGNSVLSLRRGRNITRNYTDKETKSDDNKTSKRTKVVKRKNTRSKTKVDIPRDVIDERMRNAPTDVLNTSMVIEKPADDFNKEPDPITIPPEIEKIQETEVIAVKKKPTKKEDKNLTKKEKAKALEVLEENEPEGTISPLPVLVVETVQVEVHKVESPPEKMVKKFQKLYQHGPDASISETNTTHNLLSEVDITTVSNLNVTEDIHGIQDCVDDSRCEENVTKRKNTRAFNHLEIIRSKKNEIETDKVTKRNPKLRLKINAKAYSDKIETNDKPYNSKTVKTLVSDMKETDCPETIIEDKNADIENIDNESKKKNVQKALKPKTKEMATQSDKNDYQKENNETFKTSKTVRRCGENISSMSSNKSKKTSIESKAAKKFKPKKQMHLQVVNLSVSDSQSERSIATVGITGHGELPQTPPNNLSETVTLPRELVDLNESMQNYYFKLRTETNMKEQSLKNNSKSSVSSKASEKVKSPIVVLQRISDEELSKFRSRNSSKILSDKELVRSLLSSNDSVSEVDENAKESSYKKSPVFKKKAYDISKWVPSQSDLNKSNESQANTYKTKSKNDTSEKEPNKRRSIISPIKLFDYNVLSKSQQRPKEVKTPAIKNSTPISKSTEKLAEERNYFLNKPRTNETKVNKNITLDNKESSASFDISKSSPEYSRITVKRRSGEKTIDMGKKPKQEDNDSECVVETRPSVSSVDDWLRNNVSTRSREENVDFSIRDTMQNLMEKLDVTLKEINQNTNESLLHLFVDAQKQLTEMREERRELKRRTVANFRSMWKSFEEQLAEMDRRWLEMDEEFMVDLQSRASKFLREDCKRKRAMVTILKQDVQAVSDYLDRQNK